MGSYMEYEGKLPLEFYSCVECTLQIVGDINDLFTLRKLNYLVRSAHLFPRTHVSLQKKEPTDDKPTDVYSQLV